jgi:predicted MFS family arabinose efflux permease
MAVAFGAPLGALIGGLVGWRGAYVMVAAFGVIAAGSIWLLLPSGLRGAHLPLRQRIAAIGIPGVPVALLTTWLYMTGGFTVIIYIAALTTKSIGLPAALVPAVLLSFGIGAAIGNVAGGQLSDRLGSRQTIVGAIVLSAALMFAMSGVVHLPVAMVGPVFFALIFVWGFVAWAFLPPQSSHLLGLSPTNAPLVLSLNASALYLGIAAGSFVGGLVLQNASVNDLGWIGALFPVAALVLTVVAAPGRERLTGEMRLG